MEFRHTIRNFRTDPVTIWLLVLSLLINVADWVTMFLLAPRTENISPIHYTIYFGINLTGPWTTLLWLPAVGAAAILVHIVIGLLNLPSAWRRMWMTLALLINLLALTNVLAILNLIRTYTA